MKKVFPYKSAIVVTCFPQQSQWVARELEAMNFPIVQQNISEVETEGYMDDCYALNLNLRTASRVLFQLQRFRATNADELYAKIKAIPWENYMNNDGYFTVTSYVKNDTITDDRFANVRVKDAIADRMTEKTGKRPDSGPDRDQVVVHVYWKEDAVRVYFDTSGQTIAKHGYRKLPYKAPLNESLASAILMASQWDRESTFVNPMCGSGTLAIEAALFTLNRAPAIHREFFGFMFLKGFDRDSWEGYKRLATLKEHNDRTVKIIASDHNKDALHAARENAKTAGVEELIDFVHCDYKETPIPEETGMVVMNPEYGERMGEEEELAIAYAEMGDFLKQKCKGYTGFIFTGNLALAKKVGLRTTSKTPFFNARIECRLLRYDIYDGSRK